MAKSKIFKIFVAVLLTFLIFLFAVAAYARFEFNRSFNRGLTFYHAKNYTAAEVEFKRAVFWNPYSGRAHAWLARAILTQSSIHLYPHRYQEAFAHIEEAISRGYDNDEVRYLRGIVFWLEGNFSAARVEFERSLTMNPAGVYAPMIHFRLAYFYSLSFPAGAADVEKALVHAQAAVNANPKDSDYWRILAKVLVDAGRYEEANKALEKAFTIDPNSCQIRNNKADLFLKMGRYTEAVRLANEAIAIALQREKFERGCLGVLHITRGEAYEHLGNYPSAIRDFERAIEILEGVPAWSPAVNFAKARLIKIKGQ
jgi:tetratricopeptide (TPR) repeat protein